MTNFSCFDELARRFEAPGDRPRKSGAYSSAGFGVESELRLALELLDSMLTAIEQTAWQVRELAMSAGQALVRGGEGLRELGRELADASSQTGRFVQTGFLLGKIAASYRLYRLQNPFLTQARSRTVLERLHRDNACRFRELSAEHGGAFIKVGQLLSARADLLPPVWIKELSLLQDSAPSLPFSTIRQVVESEFGYPLAEVFASFDETPIAAASIGQVHRAVSLDGREVAVKVQRPGIEVHVRSDLRLLEVFASTIAPDLPAMDWETIVREIRRAVLAEVDYVAEGRTTRTLAEFFASSCRVLVPFPVEELCSARVLTTVFVEGTKITTALDALELAERNGDASARVHLSTILGRLLEAYLSQVLEAGVFQADPHPGNLLVTRDDRVCVLDFGCSEHLPKEVRDRYLGVLRACIFGDRATLAELLFELGFATRSGRADTLLVFADSLLGELRQAVCGQAVRWPTREELMSRSRALLSACHSDPVVQIPGHFVMLARVFMTLAGMFARYQPELNVARHVVPILTRAL
jgi:ubiquinone biosynthesis protein